MTGILEGPQRDKPAPISGENACSLPSPRLEGQFRTRHRIGAYLELSKMLHFAANQEARAKTLQ